MFTGIVETTGTITAATPNSGGRRLRVDIGPAAKSTKLGDSICVSGVCLTIASISGSTVAFDVIKETLERSTLGATPEGDRVNIERSLRVGGRLDGHFVQGHVDGTARVARIQRTAQEHGLWLAPQESLRPYVIPKGSITIDGVSLTIAALAGDTFSVALIPTTLERTTLGDARQGERVNIESDVIARTIVHTLGEMASGSGLRMETLQRSGFA